jgi:secreted PhoX family phosphatase
MTCQFKCGNACDQPVPNQSANPEMADIVATAIARRSVLKGSAVGAGALVIGGLATPAAAEGRGHGAGGRVGADVGTAPFTPVAPNREDNVVTAAEFKHNVVIRWGDPVEADLTDAPDPELVAAYAPYGLPSRAGSISDRAWSEVEERFDLARHPHEAHRFGWVVEVDPMDPTSTPVKHTMLGRFKHEGANVTISPSGHAVAYMGDDERGDYVYKFVSRDTHRADSSPASRKHNLALMTAGTLYVARYIGHGQGDGLHDGTGEWIPLTSDTESFVPGMSVAEVLVFTRVAADKVGPTRMDRPEDVEANPVNGRIYAAMTNNSNRGSAFPLDEANPVGESHVRTELGGPLVKKSGNRNGYILEMAEDGGDHTATTFTWTLFLVCGDPDAPETYFGGYDKSRVSMISCPDNVAFDAAGNLWISTDGAQLGSHDGLFRVPVEGPERGNVQQFLTVPVGAETCGPLITDDQLSVFIAVQHPGETDGATFEAPTSTWPHTDGFPRPSVVAVHRR